VGLKQIAIFLLAMVFSAGAFAQDLPESPQPAATPQSISTPLGSRVAGQGMWDRMERLPRGEKIKIQTGNGRWERCMFAGVSEAYLYCASEDDSGFVRERQINRANIADFKIDHDARNGRLIVTAMAVTGGLWAGIRSYRTSTPQNAEGAGILGGLIGTGIGALVGVPLSCLSGRCVEMPDVSPGAPSYGINVNVPLRRIPRHSRPVRTR
jgi:hypothetical protein